MKFLQNNHRLLFYGAWVLLGLLQASLTELQDDEAYYWAFSRYPDWGYFDHPPLIAVLVKAGFAIFPNELGVRIFPFLLNILTLLLIEKLVDRKQPALFYAITLSIAVLQLTGFFAVPDTALLFTTVLFFHCYRRFLERCEWGSAILLGMPSALLLYSKYHGALIILFTLSSNLSLLKNPRWYLAGAVALLIFLPHLVWQYRHDWVSFRYHLLESNVNSYEPGFTASYVGGQLLLAGPVAGLILIPASLLYKPADKLQAALKYVLAGILIFFLLSSFRGKVEMNWTMPALVPMIILSHYYLQQRPGWRKMLHYQLPLSLTVVMIARILMVEDLAPVQDIRRRFHSWRDWPEKMKLLTEGAPVVFSNSYQRASKYWFYTRQTSFSQNLYREHRNQYDLWPIEDSLLGKPVYYLDVYDLHRFKDSLHTPLGFVGFKKLESFISLSKVKFIPEGHRISGTEMQVAFRPQMPAHYRNFIMRNAQEEITLVTAFFRKGRWVAEDRTVLSLSHLLSERLEISLSFPGEQEPDRFMFALQWGDAYPTHNSERFRIVRLPHFP